MAYLAVSYFLVAILAVFLAFAINQRVLRIVVVTFVLVAPLVPYIRVEVQTKMYGRALFPAIRGAVSEALDPQTKILQFKILSITPTSVQVYVQTMRDALSPTSLLSGTANAKDEPCGTGITVELIKKKNHWQFNGNYDAVWSDCGSADGNIFPPYPAKGDFS